MSPHDELLHLVVRYFDGQAPLSDVAAWLEAHGDVVFDDEPTRELVYGTWTLLSEYDLGHRTEDSIRDELRTLRVAA